MFIIRVDYLPGANEEKGKTNVNEPPKPMTLAQSIVIDSTILKLTWLKNEDEDFDYYAIYHSESTPVDPAEAALIAIINGQNTFYYNDANLIKNKTYY